VSLGLSLRTLANLHDREVKLSIMQILIFVTGRLDLLDSGSL
jgi:hypothetical protein